MHYSASFFPQVPLVIIGELILAHFLQMAIFKWISVLQVKILNSGNTHAKNFTNLISFSFVE